MRSPVERAPVGPGGDIDCAARDCAGVLIFWFAKKPSAIDSIAVLPFTYTNSDQKEMIGPDANWLSDGITESIDQ